jgi:hypothetical protein
VLCGEYSYTFPISPYYSTSTASPATVSVYAYPSGYRDVKSIKVEIVDEKEFSQRTAYYGFEVAISFKEFFEKLFLVLSSYVSNPEIEDAISKLKKFIEILDLSSLGRKEDDNNNRY